MSPRADRMKKGLSFNAAEKVSKGMILRTACSHRLCVGAPRLIHKPKSTAELVKGLENKPVTHHLVPAYKM